MFFVGFFFGVLLIIVLLAGWQATYPDGTGLTKEIVLEKVFQKRGGKKKTPKYISEEEQWKKEQNQPPKDPGE